MADPGSATAVSEAPPREAIAAYYDYTTPLYRMFWHGETGAVHYGFRDDSTRTAHEELVNTNRFMASICALAPSMRVLDAGCGIGGSAVWIASHHGARVVGITLSEKQARHARTLARRNGVADRVAVYVGDYRHTAFPDGSFDLVWALESVCYASDKRVFLREALRVLRVGGQLVVGDGFLLRQPGDRREQRDYARFRRGLVLPEVGTVEAFRKVMVDLGFADVRSWDKTRAATPSARRLWRRSLFGYPVALVSQAAGLTPPLLTDNLRAGLAQYRMVRRGVIGYAVLYGRKVASVTNGGAAATP
jgi:cyclopropane fatty-acyl-phospholipid synthase-like methyltransferase